MNQLKSTMGAIREGWLGLSTPKKAGLITALLSIFLLVSGLSYYSQRVEYTTLFSGLEEADAGIIVNDLEAKAISYKLEDNGRTILIDDTQLDKYRIQLAVDGMMPETSTGFEIFDETSMMATDEDRNIMYQRAVTGELERAITSLQSVESAKVILSIPEVSVFGTEQPEASASVVIATKGNQQLSSATIQGVVSLVSGAVENLPTNNIKIVDKSGNILGNAAMAGSDDYSPELVTRYNAIVTNYEQQLQQKLMAALAPIYGMDNLSIALTAEMDFDSLEQEIVNYGDAAVRSQNVAATGGTVDVNEAAGETANDNTINSVISGEDGGQSSYEQTINNELDSTTTVRVSAPGTITRLTATVVYNGTLSDEQKAQLDSITKTTIGYTVNNTRTDEVQVEGIPFLATDEAADTIVDTELGLAYYLKEYGLYIAAGIAGLFILSLIAFIFRNSKEKKYRAFDEEMANATRIVEEKKVPQPPSVNNLEDDLFDFTQNPRFMRDAKVKDYVKANPEMSAEMIKIWMKDK
ncbi:flagellar basal-body MS-ring/collar protein FliF [Trichococcus pasteurii]|uniref:Flagellar M-ring protein n=1 Tax=Trichococcus pasteurii TaxID=43064 RepID=A0A1W1IIT1_9LACT|nr:flagellar basal-body MS-ring/collar protein FliF [Trichococcus pasteurii]SFE78548.1 flagellar M-ring protein FliF [Trichococcus pasteurii]SLM52845.1 flagellar m-ring protein flif [Trichococcus pasteurii]SSB93726.1 flagellar m-ring protein flif [Trichococcus pasteurii]